MISSPSTTTVLELTGNNTYSGTTIVDNGGTLRVSSLNSVFTNAALGTVHSASSSLGAPTTITNGIIHLGVVNASGSKIGSTFSSGNLIYTGTGETTDRIISLNGGGLNEVTTLTQSGTGHLKFLSSFIMGDNRGVKNLVLAGSTAGTAEIAGVIPNAGSGSILNLAKSGTGTWILSGGNLYQGTTTINASGGTLQFAKQVSLYNNNQSSWTRTNIIVNSGSTLALNVGGTGEFTTGNVTTLLTNLASGINNNGLRAGSNIGFDTTNATGGAFTISNVLANSTGTGGGALGLVKLGAGSLNLTQTNTYTGATTINGGTLLVNNISGSGTGSGNVSVTAGALGGSGTISGAVTIGNNIGSADAIFAAGNNIDSLKTGNLAFNSDAQYSCEVNATTATSDQAIVTGSVTINSAATLVVSITGTLTADQKYFIIVNNDVDGVIGSLSGLAQDSIVGTYGGVNLKISYTGDSVNNTISGGNDVVLYADGAVISAYDSWASSKGLTGLPNSSTDPAKSADPDGDGKNNLYEFAFDGNPLSGINDGKVVGKVVTLGANQVLTLTLPVRGTTVTTAFSNSGGDQLSALVDGIYYRIEGDVNLASFADSITEITGTDATTTQAGLSLPALSSNEWTYRTFRVPGTVPATPKAFIRAKVSETP